MIDFNNTLDIVVKRVDRDNPEELRVVGIIHRDEGDTLVVETDLPVSAEYPDRNKIRVLDIEYIIDVANGALKYINPQGSRVSDLVEEQGVMVTSNVVVEPQSVSLNIEVETESESHIIGEPETDIIIQEPIKKRGRPSPK